MDSVFISSIQRDFEDVRDAARRAVDSLGMRPLLAETAGASTASPQRALLDLVGRADVFLLILGPRYSKPTEDEFDEARRLAKPILVLRQTGDADPDQADFVERVAGGWKGGRLWGSFSNASDVGFAVVQALTNLRAASLSADAAPHAQVRARELANHTQSSGLGSGSIARVVHVPVLSAPLLDAIALERVDLGEQIASISRQHQLIPQSVGIEPRVSRGGIALHSVGGYANSDPLVHVGADGSVVATFSVAGDDQFGSMRVEPTRLAGGIEAAGALARAVWEFVDDRESVQQAAVVVAIPDAQYKVFGSSTGRNSIQMGSFGMPSSVVVPEPPIIVRRAEVGAKAITERLIAEARRVFADAGAIEK